MEDLTGMQLGPYRMVAPIGEGGMAAVYKAYQPSNDRNVAVKVLPRELALYPEFVSRFQREAKVIAKLVHPRIVPVYDFGQAQGYTYLVMPLIQGCTLAQLLTGRPLPLPQINRVIAELADALDYAHVRGIVHRDLKPSNVLLDEHGNCMLTDFGLAQVVADATRFTQTGLAVGSPTYMSPEQGRGEKVDQRSDIYSLGVVLYQMATGQVPFDANTPVAVLMKHIQDPLPSARALNPSLPEAMEQVIGKAMAKAPADRFATAGEMALALKASAAAALPDPAKPGAGTGALLPLKNNPVAPSAPRAGLRAGVVILVAGGLAILGMVALVCALVLTLLVFRVISLPDFTRSPAGGSPESSVFEPRVGLRVCDGGGLCRAQLLGWQNLEYPPQARRVPVDPERNWCNATFDTPRICEVDGRGPGELGCWTAAERL